MILMMLCQRKTKTERPVLPSADTGPETSERCSPARADCQKKNAPISAENHEKQNSRSGDQCPSMIGGYAEPCTERHLC